VAAIVTRNGGPPSGWRVLVVEDHPDHALMLQRTLESSGRFHVTVTRNGREAREALTGDRYDAVVTDHRLPDTEGARLVKEIRGTGFGGIVLLVTAQATDEVANAGLDAGATDYVFKARGYAARVLDELVARLEDAP
jgi:DNA-binding response OmpR family regulator